MKNIFDPSHFLNQYSDFQNPRIHGRYLPYHVLHGELDRLKASFQVDTIGNSVLGQPIQQVRIGKGPIKILGWSQMHGNESTTTKALLDLMQLFSRISAFPEAGSLLSEVTFLVIPMLNPDGADRYTRINANEVDLNRDAWVQNEPESRVLRKCFEEFQPHFCFNLHDQRTIFSAGDTSLPASLSFLAPAMDPARTVTASRQDAMGVISAISGDLRPFLPGQIGRYDDSYNINCTGDSFQTLGVPTILFESGHIPGDYLREETRKLMALSILSGLSSIASGEYRTYSVEAYEALPENRKNLVDCLLRNVKIRGQVVDVAIQFREELQGQQIKFIPVVQEMGPDLSLFGHREIDCGGKKVAVSGKEDINENDIVAEILLNGEKLSIKTQDIP